MAQTLSFKEALALKMAEARKDRETRTEQNQLALLDNQSFVEAKVNAVLKSEELLKLNMIVEQVNQISPFVSKDGTKYGIRVFSNQFFGLGFGQVVGLIKGSDNAFTDEMIAEYSAITGISEIELREASHYLGSVAYCNKEGIVVESIPCDFKKFQPLLYSIAMSLELDAFDVSSLSEDKIDLWFAREETKALRKSKEILDAENLDAQTKKFVVED